MISYHILRGFSTHIHILVQLISFSATLYSTTLLVQRWCWCGVATRREKLYTMKKMIARKNRRNHIQKYINFLTFIGIKKGVVFIWILFAQDMSTFCLCICLYLLRIATILLSLLYLVRIYLLYICIYFHIKLYWYCACAVDKLWII